MKKDMEKQKLIALVEGRLASGEGKDALVEDLANYCGVGKRMVYNWLAPKGSWPTSMERKKKIWTYFKEDKESQEERKGLPRGEKDGDGERLDEWEAFVQFLHSERAASRLYLALQNSDKAGAVIESIRYVFRSHKDLRKVLDLMRPMYDAIQKIAEQEEATVNQLMPILQEILHAEQK